MFALDTNTLVYFAERLLATPPTQIAVPTIVLYELYFGIAKSTSPERRIDQLHEMMKLVTVLEFCANSAHETTIIRAALEARGSPIGLIDNLIAGTARANNAVLVTRNEREFSRVEGLRIENWY